jgi:hypothetical protein
MTTSRINLNEIIRLSNHNQEVAALIRKPSQTLPPKSRNRHLLRAYRDLKKLGFKVSWFSHSSFTISKIDYVREGVRIGIESTSIPGQFCPIEYFTVQKCLSGLQVKFPACNTPTLLQKLVHYKMITLAETLPAFEQLQSVN